jgi:hypothetical protein
MKAGCFSINGNCAIYMGGNRAMTGYMLNTTPIIPVKLIYLGEVMYLTGVNGVNVTTTPKHLFVQLHMRPAEFMIASSLVCNLACVSLRNQTIFAPSHLQLHPLSVIEFKGNVVPGRCR